MPIYKFKLLTQGDLFTYETNARTLGEFRAEIRGSEDLRTKFGVSSTSDLSELHLVERSTKTSFVLDSAALPNNNALFFVSLTKSKGGIFGESFLSTDISYEDLMDLAEYLNDEYGADIPTGDVSFDYNEDDFEYVYQKIQDFYDEQTAPEPEDTPDSTDFSSLSTKAKLELVADILLDISLDMDEGVEITGCVDGVTLEDLNREADAIYNKLVSLGYIK